MAKTNFSDALSLTLGFEGGYCDHPLDPGGATNLGITQAVLQHYRGRPVSKSDVRQLDKNEAAEIYLTRYWFAINGDHLPTGVDTSIFDLAVNSGPVRAIKILQGIVGVRQTGIVTAETMQRVVANEPKALIKAIAAERLRFLHRLSSFKAFGRGWSRRVGGIEQASLLLLKSQKA